jgi:hypothetical protein
MGKFFGGFAFFLSAALLSYFINLPFYVNDIAQQYVLTDPGFQAPQLLAAFELLHYPFLYLTAIPAWLIAGFLAGIIIRSWKGALIVSMIIGFIISLTWIFLMYRYTPNYWADFLSSRTSLEFFGRSFGTGLLFGLFSAGPAICGAYLNSAKKQVKTPSPIKEIESVCPTCGTTFASTPKYCYRCNTPLSNSDEKK